VFYALTERDLKRLLAYSSVENVGIILLGIGTGMVGSATGQPVVAALGYLAALYHALNHSFFKGLLFLGAGAIDYATHTRNLNALGGLARRMPATGGLCLLGVLAVAAIPPLNGFVSEWFTYQAFFAGGQGQAFVVRAALPLCALLLAVTGAMAAMVAIKMYGSAFLGPARSQPTANATETPGAMLAGMGILALACVALGLGAPIVAPYLATVVATSLRVPALPVAASAWVFPGDSAQAALSTPLVALLLLGFITLPLIVVAGYGGFRAGRRVVRDPWANGYGYASVMSASASSFDQPVTLTFSGIYLLRSAMRRPLAAGAALGRAARGLFARAEPVLERVIRGPTTRAVEFVGHRIQALQMGDLRVYCLYIILTLVILLIVTIR
jgi:hydrogenase-4 component B